MTLVRKEKLLSLVECPFCGAGLEDKQQALHISNCEAAQEAVGA